MENEYVNNVVMADDMTDDGQASGLLETRIHIKGVHFDRIFNRIVRSSDERIIRELTRACRFIFSARVKVTRIDIEQVTFTEHLASAVTRVFWEFYDRFDGELSMTLSLDSCAENSHFHQVLSEALAVGYFEDIELVNTGVNAETAVILRDALVVSKSEDFIAVENLAIVGCNLCDAALTALSDGIGTLCHADLTNQRILTRLELRAVHLGRNTEDTEAAVDYLAAQLSKNESLVQFVLTDVSLSDSQLARLVLALTNHPRLSSLVLEELSWHDETLKALGTILTSSKCKIELLSLSLGERMPGGDDDHTTSSKPNLQNLLQTVPSVRSSLKTLYLSECGLDNYHFRQLMCNLWKLPNLVHLDLSLNSITSFDLTNVHWPTIRSRPCSLRSLDTMGNPVWHDIDNEQWQHLISLVQTVLGLGNLGRILDSNVTERHIENYLNGLEIFRLQGVVFCADDVVYQVLQEAVHAGKFPATNNLGSDLPHG